MTQIKNNILTPVSYFMIGVYFSIGILFLFTDVLIEMIPRKREALGAVFIVYALIRLALAFIRSKRQQKENE